MAYCSQQPLSQPNIEPILLHKPPILHLPVPPAIHKLKLVTLQQCRHQLEDLQIADMLPQARPVACPKRQQTRLHLLDPRFIAAAAAVEPSLRTPRVRVGAEDLRIPVHDPRVHPHDCAGGERRPAHGESARGHDALEVQAERRVDAPCFLEARC